MIRALLLAVLLAIGAKAALAVHSLTSARADAVRAVIAEVER